MKLLHLPEAATAMRKHLGLHVAAAYALAVLEDENWLQYKGVPRDEAEEAVLAKISAIKRMGLGAPPEGRPGCRRPPGTATTTIRGSWMWPRRASPPATESAAAP
ncbi:hypothetical protein MTO96_002198 [Rhipicephalus appendiculatus]